MEEQWDRHEDEAERLLVSLRPRLPQERQDRLERKLIGAPRQSRWRAWRLGGVLAGGLAALMLLLAVVGAAPFSGDGNDLSAQPRCEYVAKRVPAGSTAFGVPAAGHPDRTVDSQTVIRYVRRCRWPRTPERAAGAGSARGSAGRWRP